MKQGRASVTNSDFKREPISHAVNVEKVSEFGNHVGRVHTGPLYEGRGYTAPVANCTVHKKGSQNG